MDGGNFYEGRREDPKQCQKMWGAVLMNGVREACGIVVVPEGSKARISETARRWITSPDFGTVCGLAGVDPERVRKFVEEVQKAPDPEARLREILSRKEAARHG